MQRGWVVYEYEYEYEHEYEHEHEHEHEHEQENWPESRSYWPLFFLNSQ
jgi:hypothetical protein